MRYYYANAAALATARSGKALPDGSSIFVEVYDAKLDGKNNAITGSDNVFVPDKLGRYVPMARDAGWGEDIPELLRNDNWSYAVFKTDKQYQANQAECLACRGFVQARVKLMLAGMEAEPRCAEKHRPP